MQKQLLRQSTKKKASPAAVPTVSVARPKSSRCRSTEIISDDEVDDVINFIIIITSSKYFLMLLKIIV